ncbi:GNAT family N-acetyltransferase [Pseudomonas sp. CC120222-01a]|uniref:GNAT family N-acetyltransferase n=1 Tax=Pseudomonas sp. CC120222-01a TaxID=1378075 RepID=UPI000D8A99EC|nr:GNAT family N-acetyltransferase [Pseudomonas sp. CC120222-01a]PVZ41163.1 acetyltransferase (GNAT) family protein [Pseudomonas sp. CC120222-01a]
MIRCKHVYDEIDDEDGPCLLVAASDVWRTFARDLTRRAMLPYYREFDLLWIEQAFDEAWGWREQWLVMEGETVLGFCSLSQDRQALFIRELHLLPEQRGRGVGSQVLETLARWAAQRRLPLLRLMVFKSNPARQLYLRHGFVEMGEDDCFVRMQRVIG